MSRTDREPLVDDASNPAGPPRLDGYGRRAVVAAAGGYGLDGFDLLILSFALSGIIATFGLSDTQAGSLTTITLCGAVVGGIGFGILADRFGRVRMLTCSIAVFAVFTGFSALAQGFDALAVSRFVAGIGIGGEFGIGMALAAEVAPARWRARATSWVAIGFQCGVLAAALLAAPVISAFGWRGLFVVGTVPGVVVIIIRSRLPESPMFLEHRGRRLAGREAPARTSLRCLVADARVTRYSLALLVLTSVQNFGYFGIMSWLPHYLATSVGLDLTRSSLWTAVTVLGMMLGIVTFGQLADRIGRRPSFRIFQIGAAVFVLLYSQLHAPTALLVGGFVMGFFANGMLGGYGALMAELYPTEARATAQNVLFNTGRFVGGFAPVAIAVVAGAHGFGHALALLSSIYVLAFAATFLIPERRGAVLD